MSLLANIIWLLTSWYVPLLYLIGGIIFFPLLPFLWPMIKYSFLPFGRVIVTTEYLKSFKVKNDNKDFELVSPVVKTLGNLLWIITFGWILALAHVIAGIINFLLIWMIVPIPNIMAHFKLVPLAFFPFGRKIISKELSKKLKDHQAEKEYKSLQ